ncbi:MAG: carbohydrate ABC transporter permease [Cellulosilyticaceae bacterium]
MMKKVSSTKPKEKKLFRRVEPILYLAPALILLAIFVYYPFFKNTILSFFVVDKYRNVRDFAGLMNYTKLFSDEKFIDAIGNTLIYVVTTVPISITIGFILALLARKKYKASTCYEALFALTMATSASVVAMIFQLAYNPSMGVVNKALGLSVNWLTDPKTALFSLVIIQIWHNIGFNFIFMFSAIRGVSDEVLESARIDGATGFSLIRKIIIPLVSPTMLFLLIKDIAYAMTTSSFTLILTGGGPSGATETMVSYIYGKAITGTNYNAAFAATTVCFALSAVMLILSLVLEKKKVTYN